jgi:hypothetical protein
MDIIKEHDIEDVRVAWNGATSAQTQRKRRYAPSFSPLWGCLFIAFVVRIWLMIHTHGVIDGDEALVGIQAEHILHGELPAYFYGQAYMGSLEAYFVALLFAIAGPSVWALRMEPILLSLVIVWLTWKLAGLLAESAHLSPPFQQIFKAVAALGAAIPPLYDVVLEMRLLGGYVEIFLLMLVLLIAAFQLTKRWQDGASCKELAMRWAAIGFVVGIGFWIDPLFVSALLAAVLWIGAFCAGEIVKQRKALAETLKSVGKKLLLGVVAIPTCVVGLAPAIIWGAAHQWANVAYIRDLGGTWSPQRLHIVLQVTQAYGDCIAPHLIGGAFPVESSMLAALHRPLFLFGTGCILATLILMAIPLFQIHPSPWLKRVWKLAALPTLFAACSSLVFCTGSASVFALMGCRLDFAGRYATPFMLALPFFFAVVCTVASSYIYEHFTNQVRQNSRENSGSGDNSTGTTPGTSRVSIRQAILFVALLAFFGTQVCTYIFTDPGETFQSNYCPVDPANNAPIIAYMQQEGIRYFWANNFLAYPIVFKTDSSIIGADPFPLLHPRIAVNRIPSYTNMVLHADRPSLLVVISASDTYPALLRVLDARHITYRKAIFPSEPGYDVLVVTPLNRTVSPLEQGFDIFTCSLAS